MMSSFLIITFTFLCFHVTISTTEDIITFSIEEELPSGYRVGNIQEKSRQILNTTRTDLRYGFLQGNTLFSINDTGDIFTSVKIDRELECDLNPICVLSFDVTVKSPDSQFYQTLLVQIYILDKNDNTPMFTPDSMNLSISEGSYIGSAFTITTAKDPDAGGNNSIQSYALVTDPSTNGTFSLSVTKLVKSFSLKLIVQKILDREVQETYNVKVIAIDGGQPPKTGTVNIFIQVADINDNAPVFTEDIYNITVSENTAVLETILNISAHDADKDKNGQILYRISEFQKDKEVLDHIFSMDKVTGALKVKADLTTVAGKTFTFIVEAVDQGSDPNVAQAQVIVYIEDSGNNAPVVSVTPGNTGYVNVSENSNNGTFVAHVNVEDTDVGLNGDVRCTVPSNYFGIETLKNKGFKVIVRGTLDREVTNIHNVTVVCMDYGTPPLSSSAHFLVRITDMNDNRPVFTTPVYTAELTENNNGDEKIVRVSATDKDEGLNSIVHYEVPSAYADRFRIDRSTGEVYVRQVFDRETSPSVLLLVHAVDAGEIPLTGTATVQLTIRDVNDNSPTFLQAVHGFKVHENQPTGTNVATMRASDLDEGRNAEFDFKIAPEYADKVPFILFSDGLLKANKMLDREEISRYDFVAIVTDHGNPARSSSSHVTVVVEDTNDNKPVVTFPRPSNNTVQAWYPDFESEIITAIEAYDVDTGVNKDLSFSIESGNEQKIFEIESLTGVLFFASKIDIGADRKIELGIAVSDMGENRLVTMTSLIVELKYTNATFLASSGDADKSKYIIISVVVVLVTLVISGVIIGVILFLRTLDRKKKEKTTSGDSGIADTDFGFMIPQSHTIISTDTLSSVSGEGRDLQKKKEVSFILDCSDSQEYHQQKHNSSMSALMEKPSKSSLRYSPSTAGEGRDGGLDARELHHEADAKLHTLHQFQHMLIQNRAQQWVQQQQQQYGDHHSDGSAETIGSDSGRGCSEEDDVFSTPSADDPKAFEVSSPESQRSYDAPMYTNIQRTSSYIKQPWTRKPHLAAYKPSTNLHINRNLPRSSNPAMQYDNLPANENHSHNRVTWGNAYYGQVAPMDYTGDSQLHSFFDKTPINFYNREDDDNCSTTTSGSYTLYSEEIL